MTEPRKEKQMAVHMNGYAIRNARATRGARRRDPVCLSNNRLATTPRTGVGRSLRRAATRCV